jgi:hypothetical protein
MLIEKESITEMISPLFTLGFVDSSYELIGNVLNVHREVLNYQVTFKYNSPVQSALVAATGRRVVWMADIAEGLAALCSCALSKQQTKEVRKQRESVGEYKLEVVGTELNVYMFNTLYFYMCEQIDQMVAWRKRYAPQAGRAYLRQYRAEIGVLIKQRLQEQSLRNQMISDAHMALINYWMAEAEDYASAVDKKTCIVV